jgi:hypothetical protein
MAFLPDAGDMSVGRLLCVKKRSRRRRSGVCTHRAIMVLKFFEDLDEILRK